MVIFAFTLRRIEVISIWRTLEQGPMGLEEIALLNLLFPHIQKALEIRQALGIMRQHLAGAEVIADASPTATFLLTRQGRVVHSNVAAEALLSAATALTMRDETLVATHGPSRKVLQSLLLNTSLPASSGSNTSPTRAMSLPRNNNQPLQLLATPLPPAHRATSGADILVLVTDPEKPEGFPDTVLRELYKLTPSETEIANGLLMGYSPNEIASLRHVSIGTVRNQLKNIMEKTATRRQADLVRLLMTLPSTLSN
jgi:DNA-binding CsgD family transcriptional regulator